MSGTIIGGSNNTKTSKRYTCSRCSADTYLSRSGQRRADEEGFTVLCLRCGVADIKDGTAKDIRIPTVEEIMSDMGYEGPLRTCTTRKHPSATPAPGAALTGFMEDRKTLEDLREPPEVMKVLTMADEMLKKILSDSGNPATESPSHQKAFESGFYAGLVAHTEILERLSVSDKHLFMMLMGRDLVNVGLVLDGEPMVKQ